MDDKTRKLLDWIVGSSWWDGVKLELYSALAEEFEDRGMVFECPDCGYKVQWQEVQAYKNKIEYDEGFADGYAKGLDDEPDW